MRVLFVCTANVCRSRVAEELFRALTASETGRHEVRSAGVAAAGTGRQVTEADVAWADVVCAMEAAHQAYITAHWDHAARKVRVFGIPDVYLPGDPVLRYRLTTEILNLLAEWPTGEPPLSVD